MYLDEKGNPVDEGSLIPKATLAFDISSFKSGASALDEMNKKEEEYGELQAMLPKGLEGPQMPPELVGKTIKELKAMGAEEIGHIKTGDGS